MAAVAALAPEDLAVIWEQCLEWHRAGHFASFGDRLDGAALDEDWIEAAVARYRAMRHFRDNYDPRAYSDMPDEHAGLLTWLLVGELNYRRTSAEFDAELLSNLGSDPSGEGRPTIIAWVVGSRIATGYWGPRILAVPGPAPSNPDVAAAYRGLVEHAAALAAAEGMFLELGRTAIVTRLAGVVDGLVMPDLRGVRPMPNAGKRLLRVYQRVESMLGPDDQRACRETMADFRHHRNVLVHVDQDDADDSFLSYSGYFMDSEALKPRLATATSIAFGVVAEEQLRIDYPPALARVQRDLDDAAYTDDM
jgi:hypothetical protein